MALGSEPGVVWVKWLCPRQKNWNIVWGVLNLPNKNIQKQPVTLHFTWTSSRQPGCIDRNASGCNAALLARSLLAVRCYVKTDLNSNCHKQARSPFVACWILYELKDETQTYLVCFGLIPTQSSFWAAWSSFPIWPVWQKNAEWTTRTCDRRPVVKYGIVKPIKESVQWFLPWLTNIYQSPRWRRS